MKIRILRVTIVYALLEASFVFGSNVNREQKETIPNKRVHLPSSLNGDGIKGIANVDTLRSPSNSGTQQPPSVPAAHLRGAKSTMGRVLKDDRQLRADNIFRSVVECDTFCNKPRRTCGNRCRARITGCETQGVECHPWLCRAFCRGDRSTRYCQNRQIPSDECNRYRKVCACQNTGGATESYDPVSGLTAFFDYSTNEVVVRWDKVNGPKLYDVRVSKDSTRVKRLIARGSTKKIEAALFDLDATYDVAVRRKRGKMMGSSPYVSILYKHVVDESQMHKANDETKATTEDYVGDITGNVLDNDVDPDFGHTLTVDLHQVVRPPGSRVTFSGDGLSMMIELSNGSTLSLATNGEFKFHRASGAYQELSGTQEEYEQFKYVVGDNHGNSAEATLYILIQGANDSPIALNDLFVHSSNDPNTIDDVADGCVLENDKDIDIGDVANLVVCVANGVEIQNDIHQHVDLGQHTMLSIGADGCFTISGLATEYQYLPKGETTDVCFFYQACDGHQDISSSYKSNVAEACVRIEGVSESNIPTAATPFLLNPVDNLNNLVYRVGDSHLTRISNRDDSVIEPTTSANGNTSTWTIKVIEGASYNALHFSDFDFDPGCEMVVSGDSVAGMEQRYVMSGFGKLNLKTFWAKHIEGDTITITTICVGGLQTIDSARFVIDEIGVGYPLPLNDNLGGRQLEICGADDKRDAVCYNETHPTEYSKARAVTRILIIGQGTCTGWLASKSDHIMTNWHCVENATVANNVDFRFMFEAVSCGSTMSSTEFTLSAAKFIKSEQDLDFSLLRAIDVVSELRSPTSLAKKYGFLQLENRSAILGEQIYMPQHPRGRDKELAINSTESQNQNGVCGIDSLTENVCTAVTEQGGPSIHPGYLCDMEPGSSGSPVLASSSHRVIALNNCEVTFTESGACHINKGIRSDMIYEEVHDLLDIMYENDFETINPNLPPQVPQCGGAAFFGIGQLFDSPGVTFLEKPPTTTEAILINGKDAVGTSLYVSDPVDHDSGDYVLGMFSTEYVVAGERKDDALAILFHSKGYESLVIDFDFAPGAIPPSECSQQLPYQWDSLYQSELHFRLIDVPSGELDWNDMAILQEETAISKSVAGVNFRESEFSPYVIEWTHETVRLRADSSTNGNVALVVYAQGNAFYNFLDNIVIAGRDDEPECVYSDPNTYSNCFGSDLEQPICSTSNECIPCYEWSNDSTENDSHCAEVVGNNNCDTETGACVGDVSCSDDSDCPSGSVCAVGVCVRKGNPRFTLHWMGEDTNDLDLHAITPGGVELYFQRKFDSVTKGRLDKDFIPQMPEYEGMDGPWIENIYFPAGEAPDGSYEVFVKHFQHFPLTNFTLEIWEDPADAPLFSYPGQAVYLTDSPHFKYTKPEGSVVEI